MKVILNKKMGTVQMKKAYKILLTRHTVTMIHLLLLRIMERDLEQMESQEERKKLKIQTLNLIKVMMMMMMISKPKIAKGEWTNQIAALAS